MKRDLASLYSKEFPKTKLNSPRFAAGAHRDLYDRKPAMPDMFRKAKRSRRAMRSSPRTNNANANHDLIIP